MLEEHCYITDASITTFKSELFNDLVVLEARMLKLSQVQLKIWAKRGLSGVDRSKIIILHEEWYSERQISDKLKFSKTAIHQTIILCLMCTWASEGGSRGFGIPWTLKNSAQKRLFLDFEWEKTNFTTFVSHGKILVKSASAPPPEKNPSNAHGCAWVRLAFGCGTACHVH